MKILSLRLFGISLLVALTVFGANTARAQWLTQNITLQPGWNAVFLHVDASHTNLDSLIASDGANPITEVWLWQTQGSSAQFIDSPAQPTGPNSQWAVWYRSPVVADTLISLQGNGAYLVRNTNNLPYVWALKGRPIPPRYDWVTSGLNFIGFPTLPNTPPSISTFLAPVPALRDAAEIFRYPGGDLGTNNPVQISPFLFGATLVNRGQAYWVRGGSNYYNRYFGPFDLSLQNPAGIQFRDSLGTYSIRLRNTTATNQTVNVSLLASEAPPVGQPDNIVALPPLVVRGALNPTNLTYGYLNSVPAFTLTPFGQPGSEVEIVLGLDRSAMTTAPGSLYAGVLRFADAGGLSQQDVAVSATVAATTGLWVGAASINQVQQYLKSYARADNPADVEAARVAANDAVNPPGAVWTPRGSLQAWSAVASSVDGSALVAAVNPGGLFRSANYGVTWQSLNQSNTWRAVASSADGTRLVAVPRDRIYVSMNSGNHWTRRALSNDYSAVACSSDGSRMVATINGGGIVASGDFGTNWIARPAAGTARAWSGIACSADGTRLVAVVNGGGIYTSSDFGTNWTLRTNAGTARAWTCVASSADGNQLVAGVSPGSLFTSMDSGGTWTLQPASEIQSWRGLASSGDGSRLVAVPKDRIYVSANAGNNWTRRSNSNDWSSVATSLDGRRSVAVVNGGYIWTSAQTANPLSLDTNSNLIVGVNKSYIVTAVNTNIATVARPFPLRLILHSSPTNTVLLQRVFFGVQGETNFVLSTAESVLNPGKLATARRISAPHLPFSHTNTPWAKSSGDFAIGSALIFNVNLDYNDHTSNPFLHTYHPDHDNLTPLFDRVEAQGAESYGITRQIALTFNPPGTDFASVTSVGGSFGGTYSEVLTLQGRPGDTRQFRFFGSFVLNRISPIDTLTTP